MLADTIYQLFSRNVSDFHVVTEDSPNIAAVDIVLDFREVLQKECF